ncbi:hypothetical protein [Companilactobacillus sp.]|uniref:hypothetical protein n=1 Tax=Companilactobacillus sp. TaxID=2767905 RepID=UPI00262853FE|nr:hypothetical protein [Companilactobacillus sp.]
MKIKLDKKYKELVSRVKCKAEHELLSGVVGNNALLSEVMSCTNSVKETEKLISDIYFADEIEWIEPRYKWRLKSEKFKERYVRKLIITGSIAFYTIVANATAMTESELKKLLEGTGLPFEAFEKVSVDED